MNRRHFLIGLAGLVGNGLLARSTFNAAAQDTVEPAALDVKNAILNVHDPVMIKDGDFYYIFHTGTGIHCKRSKDMLTWKISRGYPVFKAMPVEAAAHVPKATDIWAPDVSFYNGMFRIYYAVSTFGSSRSAIGLTVSKTLDPDSPDFKWEDQGIVVKTSEGSTYNAIDPNFVVDADGNTWLAFGSYWTGIKLIRLDNETGKPSSEDSTVYSIASRPSEPPNAIEGAFIISRNGYYYLFASFDACCQGINSTYNVRVGRAETITGPYVDRNDVAMLEGGGTQITFPTTRYKGPGHNGIFSENGQDYMVYHAYDAVQGGTPTLRISPLVWDDEGWPSIPPKQT